jgi:hypothetical protein
MHEGWAACFDERRRFGLNRLVRYVRKIVRDEFHNVLVVYVKKIVFCEH